MKDKFECFIFDSRQMTDIHGHYDIKMHDSKIEWEGVDYEYHSSGLVRCVYISPCRTFVLKVPIAEMYSQPIMTKQFMDETGHISFAAEHNILEALAYEQCPDDLKHWFAKTEMLPMGWLKQEYVDVHPMSYSHNMREIGIRPSDGQKCLFDYNIIIDRELYDKISPSLNEVQFERRQFERAIKIMEEYG